MKGFTLVEMLVALLIFSGIAAAGVAVMSLAADNRTVVQHRMERLASFQRTRGLLKADLEQAADRPTRDEAGLLSRNAMGGGEGSPILLFLTRRGLDNPDGEPRASMQYVEYRLADGRLERRVRPFLDGAQLGEPQVLIDGVKTAEIAFYSRGEWRSTWTSGTGSALPRAVRLQMDISGFGPVRQLFLVPGAL